MARPPSQSAAERHQAGQSLLVSGTAAAVLAHAWPQLDLLKLNATFPQFLAVIMAILHRYGSASSVHAAQFYKEQRVAAGVPGRISVPVAKLPPVEQVESELRWAVSDLYGATHPVATPAAVAVPEAAVAAPETPLVIEPEAVDAALTKVQGVTEKLVLDQSRQTILDAVQQDREARGWARVPEAGACSFCLLLATRGAVYKTKETAGPNVRGARNKRAGMEFKGGGAFKVHDHCRCHVEPQFSSHYEPTAQVRAAQELYASIPYGSSPEEARNNFRVALANERDAGRFAG